MEKSQLKDIVLDQAQARQQTAPGIPRDARGALSRYAALPHAVITAGVRRCGKSTLLDQVVRALYKDDIYYFSFEDERLVDFTVHDFNNLFEVFLELYGERTVFLLDEVQNVPQWELFVRRLQEKGYKFFITGSNASLLGKELGTRLTGRNILFELFPFSFSEYLRFKGYQLQKNGFVRTKERAAIKKYFSEYLRYGGMPEYVRYGDITVLKRVYEDILYRDIVARYGIKQVKPLRELGLYLMSNIGGMLSYNNLKNVLGVGSMNTIKSYADYMENSYLIFLVSKFSYSLKEQFIAHKKIYCVDNGIPEAVAFQFSHNRGKFLENLVFLGLRRRYKDIYYYKTSHNREVNFLVREGKERLQLIQVAEHLRGEKVRLREIAALEAAMRELKLTHAHILTDDTVEDIRVQGGRITVQPVYQWLLENEEERS